MEFWHCDELDKGETVGAHFWRKMMNMVLPISSLECLLNILMEMWSSFS